MPIVESLLTEIQRKSRNGSQPAAEPVETGSSLDPRRAAASQGTLASSVEASENDDAGTQIEGVFGVDRRPWAI